MNIGIRAATIADSDQIARLVSELGYPTSSSQQRARLARVLDDEDYRTLVGCEGEQIVGFIGTRVGFLYEGDEPYGQIMAFVIGMAYQRRGIGGQLLQAAESILTDQGARVLIVTTANHRAQAHAFYEKNGYTFTGRRYRKIVAQPG